MIRLILVVAAACPALAQLERPPLIDLPAAVQSGIAPVAAPAAGAPTAPLALPALKALQLAVSPEAAGAIPAAEPAKSSVGLSAAFDGAGAGPGEPAEGAPAAEPAVPALQAPHPFGRLKLGAALDTQWRDYHGRWKAASDPVVRDPSAFFGDIFDLGELWWTSTLWGRRKSEAAMERTARRAAVRYFYPAAPQSRAAFEAFLGRVFKQEVASPNIRRKRVRDALLEASLRPASGLPAFFDNLLGPEDLEEARRFRRERMPVIIETFTQDVVAMIARFSADPSDPRGNVAGLLWAGSYPFGAARPSSDLDFAIMTWDGTEHGVPEFMAALSQRGLERSWPSWNDWRRYRNVIGVDDGRARRFIRDFKTIVLTPHERVRRAVLAGSSGGGGRQASKLEDFFYHLTEPAFRWYLRRRLRMKGL